jgi:hypothetical protein
MERFLEGMLWSVPFGVYLMFESGVALKAETLRENLDHNTGEWRRI